jgi:hypothetical protein
LTPTLTALYPIVPLTARSQSFCLISRASASVVGSAKQLSGYLMHCTVDDTPMRKEFEDLVARIDRVRKQMEPLLPKLAAARHDYMVKQDRRERRGVGQHPV